MKRVNWQNNERVDKPDMIAGTNTLAVGVGKQLVERLLLAKFPTIASGFRVQIPNQGTSPGEITVYNGYGYNRDGETVQNEDEENTSRSYTFLADGQYFLEVYFLAVASDTDARGFWDPKYDNGTDPSGDERLPGREFSQNVSTRLTPDWQIVTPVSTTGFEVLSNPDSVKVPVAVIQVAGGVVVNATTVPAHTVLAEDASLGATKIKVFDSRFFPDSFPATLGGVAINVSSNDRRNGWLTLSAGLAAGHSAGERVIDTTANALQFLVDRSTPALPSTQSRDARARFFQGNENRGWALSQNPDNAVAPNDRSDTSIQDLKDQIDFLSAQLRELRFGAARDVDVGQLSPPASFPASPRYFDRSGGVAGARTNSVSVGDGVTSFGDFNTNVLGVTGAFQAAVNAVGGGVGGTVFVKRGTYVFTGGPVVIANTQTIRLIGESQATTLLKASGALPALSVSGGKLRMEELQLIHDAGSTAPGVVRFQKDTGVVPQVSATSCIINGLYANANTDYAEQCRFQGCTFNLVANGNQCGVAADFVHTTFDKCLFTNAGGTTAAGARCVKFTSNGSAPSMFVLFSNCKFLANGGPTIHVEFVSDQAMQIKFDECEFLSNASTVGVSATQGITGLTITDSYCDTLNGLCSLDNAINAHIQRCTMYSLAPGGSNAFIYFGDIIGNTNVHVDSCRMEQVGVAVATLRGVVLGNTTEGYVTNCKFVNCDIGVEAEYVTDILVSDNEYSNQTGGRAFLYFHTATYSCRVRGNYIYGVYDSSANGVVVGLRFDGVVDTLTITGNDIRNIGNNTVAASAIGIWFNTTVGLNNCARVLIEGNTISNVDTKNTNTAYGIRCASTFSYSRVVNNTIMSTGLDSAGAYGMYFLGGLDVVVASNVMLATGLLTTLETCGIYVGYGSTNAVGWAITGNVIQGVGFSTSTFTQTNAGILFNDCGSRITISGNTIDPHSAAFYGIKFNNPTAGRVINVTIVGNTIGSDAASSVWWGIDFACNGAQWITVNGNTITNFEYEGVIVDGSLGTCFDVTINNNNMYTSWAGSNRGAHLFSVTRFSITGNKITFANNIAADWSCIYGDGASYGVVSGNSCYEAHSSATYAVIYFANSLDVMFSGNFMDVANNASTGVGIKCATSGNMIAYANMYRVPTGSTQDYVGLNYTNARKDSIAAPNATTNPAAGADIGLNISIN